MKSNIFIPEIIKVGFQERDNTYTGKLAYVIYYDQKGILRKEKSWNSWRDEKIPDVDFKNVPTSGFVLNKKVGGYSTGWNHRQTYVRVYDPRGFEFEISVPNLLHILENTDCIKGKGLEGEFIYGFDGTELVLIPTSSPDYIEITKYNEVVHKNETIKAKDLKIGAIYRTKDNEEWIYMGRFDYWREEYIDRVSYNTKDVNKGKYYYFIKNKEYKFQIETYYDMLVLKNLGNKFIENISSDCVENYAELFEKLECTQEYSPIDKSKTEYMPYTFEEFKAIVYNTINNNYNLYFYNQSRVRFRIYKIHDNENKFCYENQNNWKKVEDTIENIYEKFKPMYKITYLKNGKVFRRE